MASIRRISLPRSQVVHFRAPCSSRDVKRCAAATQEMVTDQMLEVAQRLAREAAVITTQYFRTNMDVDDKEDQSPVTIADREAETVMRQIVQEAFPTHAVFGEEFGYSPGEEGSEGSDFMWVFDPIDGTKAFITGKPSWGTLIALLHHGVPILGIIDQPVTKDRWLGIAGRQSLHNGHPISTRQNRDLSKAYMYSTTPAMFTGAAEPAYNRLKDSVNVAMYGADCYAYGLLASGFVDIVAEADLKPYDYMACIPIIKGAGGVITDWNDRELSWTPDVSDGSITAWAGEVLAAGDRVLHAEALKALDFTLSNPNA